MKKHIDILDISTELAEFSSFEGGPSNILKRLKDKFKVKINQDAEVRQLNESLSQHTYTLSQSSLQLSISFLFHALSGRWYVNAIQ